MLAYFSTTIHIVGSEINFVVSYSFETAFLSAHRCKKHHEFTCKNIFFAELAAVLFKSNTFNLHLPWMSQQVSTACLVCTKVLWQTRKSFVGGHPLKHFSHLALKESLQHDLEAKSSNRNKTHMHFSHTQRSQAYLADGEPSLRRRVCRLKAEQADCRAKQVADSNANHMSTYPGEVRQGSECPLRLP